jgi:pyrroline-5-carboxylate reductase
MNISHEKIGFIGAGNMANALIKGLIASGQYTPKQILASDSDPAKLRSLSKQYGIEGYTSNNDLVRKSTIMLVAVKPQVIRDVLKGVKDDVREEHLIISIAAGISTQLIRSLLDRDMPIIRVMPNTPALIQKGISALAPNKTATSNHMALAQGIFHSVGETVVVDEGMMNAVTALSGSGPGFIFRIMESFVSAGESVGFEAHTALRLVMQTFLGTAALANESDLSLAQLREMVTSPGGTTAAGLNYFEENGLTTIIQGAVEAACRRGVELGKGK